MKAATTNHEPPTDIDQFRLNLTLQRRGSAHLPIFALLTQPHPHSTLPLAPDTPHEAMDPSLCAIIYTFLDADGNRVFLKQHRRENIPPFSNGPANAKE